MREMVEHLKVALAPFNYVVQRNWEELPNLDPNHPDLDLFVSDEDYNDCLLITQEFPWVDLRHPSDNYYPEYISNLLLTDRQNYEGWAIPNPKASFLSLYYHAIVHKASNKYEAELRRIFLQWIKPIKADDEGVGYYV